MATLNINEFGQSPVRGDVDLQVMETNTITCLVSPNQATALKAGDVVAIDGTVVTPMPQVVAAGSNSAIGVVKRTLKQSQYSAGDAVEVVGFFGGCVWLVAGGTVTAGTAVQEDGSGGVVTKSSGKQVGVALDHGTSGNLLRVLLGNPLLG